MITQAALISRAFERATKLDLEVHEKVVGVFWVTGSDSDSTSITCRLVADGKTQLARIDRLDANRWPKPWEPISGMDASRIWARLVESQFEGGSRRGAVPDYHELEAIDAIVGSGARPRT